MRSHDPDVGVHETSKKQVVVNTVMKKKMALASGKVLANTQKHLAFFFGKT